MKKDKDEMKHFMPILGVYKQISKLTGNEVEGFGEQGRVRWREDGERQGNVSRWRERTGRM